MEIGIVSDIHGNLPALEAVKNELDSKSVEQIVCLGDTIGYNPWPRECLEVVHDWADILLQGNHDRDVVDPDRYLGHEMPYEGLVYAKSELTQSQIEWLQSLPEKTVEQFGEVSYMLVHSHPEQTDKYVRPGGFPRMRPFLNEESGCFLGHTHVQHKAVIDGKLILNPGSVGQPRDNDSRAAYAVVDTENNSATLNRVSYDIDRVIEEVNRAGLPERIGSRLK